MAIHNKKFECFAQDLIFIIKQDTMCDIKSYPLVCVNVETIERTFQISSDLFWGYSVNIDISKLNSITSIIEYIKTDLKNFLLSKNLQLLIEKLDQRHFHIHSPHDNYNDLLNHTDTNTIIYICDHC